MELLHSNSPIPWDLVKKIIATLDKDLKTLLQGSKFHYLTPQSEESHNQAHSESNRMRREAEEIAYRQMLPSKCFSSSTADEAKLEKEDWKMVQMVLALISNVLLSVFGVFYAVLYALEGRVLDFGHVSVFTI